MGCSSLGYRESKLEPNCYSMENPNRRQKDICFSTKRNNKVSPYMNMTDSQITEGCNDSHKIK